MHMADSIRTRLHPDDDDYVDSWKKGKQNDNNPIELYAPLLTRTRTHTSICIDIFFSHSNDCWSRNEKRRLSGDKINKTNDSGINNVIVFERTTEKYCCIFYWIFRLKRKRCANLPKIHTNFFFSFCYPKQREIDK